MGSVIVVGGGPAGASLAHLLADRGVTVTLVERQSDFAREFRGEVLLPSGIEALRMMGLEAALRAAPQFAMESLRIDVSGRTAFERAVTPDDFGGHPPLAVSQAGLLEGIVAEAAQRPSFTLLRGVFARELLREGGRVTGVRVRSADGPRELRADLVVGADGRASIVRRGARLEAVAQSPPMDIVWCKLPALPSLRGARGYIGRGHLLIAYHTYGDALQLAWIILKGTYGELRQRGMERWVEEMTGHVSDDLAAHLRAHRESVKHPFLLDVISDRATPWSAPGALVIGDAAHTMSPVGGQGLNVALRDAIVAANHLVPLLAGDRPADAAALDAAARRIEVERLPEIEALQRIQAIPPRIVLSRAWWGEPLRRVLARLLPSFLGRRAGAADAALFLFGKEPVRLAV